MLALDESYRRLKSKGMSYKTKLKIEQAVFFVVTLIGYMGIGASVGIFLYLFEKQVNRDLKSTELVGIFLGFLATIYIAYFINLCLHEVGHMIFGLLTGYQFESLRFGKWMLAKKEGKLHVCRFNLPGTGGQCIMSAPDMDAEHMPVVLYNLGGLIINFITFLLGVGLFFVWKNTALIAGMISLLFGLVAFVFFISNGMPFVQLGTDGANAIILHKDKQARAAFRKQLEVIRYMSNGYSIYEMPEELFVCDPNLPMDNPLITAQAVNYYNYLSANKRYEEAKQTALFILEKAKSINQIHEKILYGELIFIAAVIEHDRDSAKKQYELHKKELKSLAGFISMQRILYAYFTLVEPDEKKAREFEKMFKKSLKNYPYPKDAAAEKEQFDLVSNNGGEQE